jgi:hypothetical protein
MLKDRILDAVDTFSIPYGKYPAIKFYLIGLAAFVMLQLVPFLLARFKIIGPFNDTLMLIILGIILLSCFIIFPCNFIALITALLSAREGSSNERNGNIGIAILVASTTIIEGVFTYITWQ